MRESQVGLGSITQWLVRLLFVLLLSYACAAIWHVTTSAAAGSAISEAPAVPEVPMSFQPPFSSASPPTASQLETDAVSRTLYEHLGSAAAVSLATRTFGIAKPTWQAPGAEGEGKVESYVNNLAAVEKTPGGHSVVVASTVPLRVNSGLGLAPTSLTLKHEGSVFLPENPVVPVAISDQASGGVTFGEGLSVTPVGVSGAEAASVVGNHAVFSNVARDTDLMAAPTPGGAEISWQLRSQASPSDERLLFHLPSGVVLQPSSSVPGGAEVVIEGKTALLVEPAVAQDAEGRSVPVSVSVEGATLDFHLDLSGPVDFPVLVDPYILIGEYGTYGGSSLWSSWKNNKDEEGCSPECFSFIEAYNLLQTGANVGAPTHTVGAWSVTTPGPANKPGSAGITRVDLEGVIHHPASQSQLIATIEEDNGKSPIFSWNGTGGLSGTLPLYDQGELSSQSIAFCAEGDNGKDGGNPPLCDEEHYQGHSFVIEDELLSAPSEFNYVRVGGAKVTYRDVTGPNRVELIHPGGNDMEWVKTPPSGYKVSAEDEGLGIKKVEIQAPFGHEGTFKEQIECSEAHGFHGCPNTWESGSTNLSGLDQQESGEYSLTAVATDAAGNAEPSKTPVPLFLDHEGPAISFSGPLAEAAGGNVGEGNYLLHFAAADGSPARPQSGTYTLEVTIDGRSVFNSTSTCPKPEGRPAEGCYALSGSWTMGAQRYGVGTHAITVTAKDWLGNESTKTLYVTVNGAAYEPLGPGSVNLTTGDYKLQSTDVSLPDGPAGLSVSRTYDSRSLTQGAEGPLGPNWTLSLPDEGVGDWQSLTAQPGGSVLLSTATGTQAIFTAKEGGGFVSPAGFQNLTLTKPGTSEAAYEIKDAHSDYARFLLASHSLYVPATIGQADGAGGLDRDTFSFTTTSEGITEPTKELAPEPSKGACTTTLVKGCRELTFNYATSTTASGEGPAQWGDYKGRLTRVYFTAWEPVKGEMSAPIIVAQYAYDLKGRLRAEWDPRIEPTPLKTYYGYDAENHVTSVTPPGQQPWLIHYGTGTGDPVTGRALSVSRPAATTTAKLKERDEKTVPTNSVAPTLSTGTPTIGTTMSVSSSGTWSNEPLAYAYQWQRCSAAGSECAAIEGATNKTYTPQPHDGGYTLKAQVSATNVNGTGTGVSAASSALGMPAPSSPALFSNLGCNGNGTFNSPQGDAVDPSGNVWVANYGGQCVEEISPKSPQHVAETCSEGLVGPMGVAVTATHVYVADNATSTVDVYSTTCGSHKTIGSAGTNLGQLEHPEDVAVDASENVWVADTGNNRIEEFSAEGAYITSYGKIGADRLSSPISIAFANGDLYIVEAGNSRVVIATPTGQLVGQFGSAGTGPGQFTQPAGIAEDPVSGALEVVDAGNNRVELFNQAGAFLAQFGSTGSGENQFKLPLGIAVNATGTAYIGDNSNNRVQSWEPSYSTNNPAPTPPTSSGESIWSVDYSVPLSGTGHNELASYASWGQTDAPVEGTAIYPPDEPMGWPAASYKRATITYLDHLDRAVNTALPGGGISTNEYDGHDNTTRTLTADNLVRAIAAGELNEKPGHFKVKERAEQIDTKNTYSSDGTELLSTLGPEHTVKTPSLGQIEARKHVTYAYDEGAPSGPEAEAPYRLLTKTTEGAEYIQGGSHYETDVRTVKTGYSGQAGKGQNVGIGWELHEPTSTTVTAGSQELTKSTFYSLTTGGVTETRSPDGSYGKTPPFSYLSAFGQPSGGKGLNEPRAVAVLSSGNVDVLSAGNNMIDEYSTTGTLAKEFGGTGAESGKLSNPYQMTADNEGNVIVADTGNNRIEKFNSKGEATLTFGKAGSGAGELKEPKGVAVNPSTGMIYVSDSANNRIDKFTKTGVFVEMFGFGVQDGQNVLETCKSSCRAGLAGSAAGELNEPRGIAFTGGDLWVANYMDNRADEFTEAGAYLRSTDTIAGSSMSLPKDVAVDSAGDLFVADTGQNEIEEYAASGTGFLWKAGTQGTGSGQFEEPWGLALSANNHLYVADRKNNRADQWVPTMLGNPAAHDTQIIYYTSGTEASLQACQNHAEWAGLPCQEQPAAQPEDGLPALPTSTYTYNMWQEPLTTTDTSGTTTRKTTITYDNAGRPKTVSITSSIGTPIATTSDTYNELNGSFATQSRTTEGVTKKLSGELNTLGQLASYTDADSNTATYTYDEDDRLKTITDAKGTQTFGYSTTTGLTTSLTDSAAGTFTAGYDAEENLTSQGYPNGMTATYGLNPVGATTSIEYLKTTHCATNCTWYKETQIPSIHGETVSQTSTLASEENAFDSAGRLTESKTTPVGGGCTTLEYGYELDSNRTRMTTVPPETGGKCATSGGTLTTTAYDSGERLDEPGFEYDAFGNTKTVPAGYAGTTALTSTFYADDWLASVTQNGETIGYQLDPEERTRETVSTGKTVSDVISHYDGPGGAPAWTEEPVNGHWTRDIPGLGGGLAAIQTNNGTSNIELEITNLHGDVIGTAKDASETETHLENTTEASEYGIPTVTNPPKYSWLGALQRPTELPSGMIAMGARGYIPQLGRFLQTDPSPGGSNNPYGYTNQNPIDEADPTGEWTTTTTYNYEAASTGQATIPIEGYIEAGALSPPPVDIQAEEELDANPPWNAANQLEAAGGLPQILSEWLQPGDGDLRASAARANCTHVTEKCIGGGGDSGGACEGLEHGTGGTGKCAGSKNEPHLKPEPPEGTPEPPDTPGDGRNPGVGTGGGGGGVGFPAREELRY